MGLRQIGRFPFFSRFFRFFLIQLVGLDGMGLARAAFALLHGLNIQNRRSAWPAVFNWTFGPTLRRAALPYLLSTEQVVPPLFHALEPSGSFFSFPYCRRSVSSLILEFLRSWFPTKGMEVNIFSQRP